MNGSKPKGPTSYIIDRKSLPAQFPTHRHSAEFWEALGRTIATFAFLEDTLGRAIFAFTATRAYPSEEIEEIYQDWLPKMERALTDQLWNLAEVYAKSVKEHPDATIKNIDELISEIKEATTIRNVLCHGSWGLPDKDGKSVPRFVSKKGEKFETGIDIPFLIDLQISVQGLISSVIDSVTHMGWEFPGGAGPGEPIWR